MVSTIWAGMFKFDLSLRWEVDWHVDDAAGEDQIHILDLWICLLDSAKTETMFLSNLVERITFFDGV